MLKLFPFIKMAGRQVLVQERTDQTSKNVMIAGEAVCQMTCSSTKSEFPSEEVRATISEDAMSDMTDTTAASVGDAMSISSDSAPQCHIDVRLINSLCLEACRKTPMSINLDSARQCRMRLINSLALEGCRRSPASAKILKRLHAKKRSGKGKGGQEQGTYSKPNVGALSHVSIQCRSCPLKNAPGFIENAAVHRMWRHGMLVEPSFCAYSLDASTLLEPTLESKLCDFFDSSLSSGTLIEGPYGLKVWPSCVPRADINLEGTIWEQPKPSRNWMSKSGPRPTSRISL
eukprot:TRINITY_DN14516_c0_g2_i2.p1 TRINITY_DN14516_c0_g2~~TRINITY_DN14516_c0_g2_i2.p1  ORF type:complete len:288 (+),score=37.94 TRINITY_DN14516_c0_g2_i2:51-914(+)